MRAAMRVVMNEIKNKISIFLIWSKIFVGLVRKIPLKIILGSAGIDQDGWISTDINTLNILNKDDWLRYFKPNSIDALLAEHVWEHFTYDDAVKGAENCFFFLKKGGYIRIAVPDGFHPHSAYIEAVKPMGFGFGADDHKVLYNYKSISAIFMRIGFKVEYLEYFNEDKQFCSKEWDARMGLIKRSKLYDDRNNDNQLKYTSIIIDAWKK